MKALLGIFAGIGINVVLTLIGHGRFMFDILILAACLWIAVPLFIFSGIFLAIAYRKPNSFMIDIGQWIMLVSLVIGSTWTSIYMGGFLNQREIRKAKTYCEQLAERLDQVKEQNGSYPADLVGIIDQSDLPEVLNGGNLHYHSHVTNFSITFSDPGGLMSGWNFLGNTKEWSSFD